MTTTFPITKKTGYAGAYRPRLSVEASTFHTHSMRLDAVVAVAEAVAIVEDDFIMSHYELMPKRTIAELAGAYKARLGGRSHERYIDIDLPLIDDGGDW